MKKFFDRFSFHFYNDWPYFKPDCAFYEFNMFKLFFELDRSLGQFEIMIIVFGIGGNFVFQYGETDTRKEITKLILELRENLDGK